MEDRGMLQKKHTPEEIFAKLRQVDVLVTLGHSVAEEEPTNFWNAPAATAPFRDCPQS
jgi:hypothetical protein